MTAAVRAESRRELFSLIRGQRSYNDAQRLFYGGFISQRTFVSFVRLWRWGAFRSSCPRQDSYFNRFGKDSYFARIERTNALIRKIGQATA